MHPHRKFEIAYSKHVGNMLWIRFSRTEARGQGPLHTQTACNIPRLQSVFSNQVWEFYVHDLGAQWLSGRVLDSRPKGRGFEPHRRYCVVVLEQDTFILA